MQAFGNLPDLPPKGMSVKLNAQWSARERKVGMFFFLIIMASLACLTLLNRAASQT